MWVPAVNNAGSWGRWAFIEIDDPWDAEQTIRQAIPVLSTEDSEGYPPMAAARSFTELLFWQRARKWSQEIFQATQKQPFAKDGRLVVQINDSSESVMANMAEGFGRGTQNEFVLFLGYAIGSLDETQSHLCAAYDRKYLSKDVFAGLFREGTAIRKLTVAFIRSMVLPRGGVKTLGKRPSLSNQTWEIYERVTGKPRPPMWESTRDPPSEPRNDTPPF